MINFNLKKVMKEKKMTLKELSLETSLSINTLSLLSTGKSKGIQFDTLEKLIQALDCNVKDLILVDDGYKTLKIIDIEKSKHGAFIFNKQNDNRIHYFICTFKENEENEYSILFTILFSNEYIEVAISGDFPKEFLKSGKYCYRNIISGETKDFITLDSLFITKILRDCYIKFEEIRNLFKFKDQEIILNLMPYKNNVISISYKDEKDFLKRNLIPAYSHLKDLVFLEKDGIKVSNNFYKEEEIPEDDI
ncbi:helix-turn-helix domain-containing protein [Bacillaceae bacterium HSR45]|nr:helix-turn-helix domain-containing protein [Bacillaceae bacterium HSR45]